jgi:hypothetical protein
MDQVSINYTNIFHCKTLQNLPKFVFFLFENKPSGNPGQVLYVKISCCLWIWGNKGQGHPSQKYLCRSWTCFSNGKNTLSTNVLYSITEDVVREKSDEKINKKSKDPAFTPQALATHACHACAVLFVIAFANRCSTYFCTTTICMYVGM